MALYTVRTDLSLPPMASRGSNVASMSHHFEWPDDETALAEYRELEDHFTNSPVADRFTCARGSALHLMTLYRRDIFNARSFARLDEFQFTLADYINFDFNVTVGGVEFGVDVKETPIFNNRRATCLVIQKGQDPRCVKRTYVGPLSPMYFRANAEFIFDVPGIMLGVIGPSGDDPPREYTGYDGWYQGMADWAAGHVHNLQNDLTTGVPVCVSWKLQIRSPVHTTRASWAYSDLRSRARRADFTDVLYD